MNPPKPPCHPRAVPAPLNLLSNLQPLEEHRHIQVFKDISSQEFEDFAKSTEESKRPKLSYSPEKGILITELPTASHKFALTDFRRVVESVLDTFPIDNHLLRTTLEPNLTLQSSVNGFSAEPDLALVTVPLMKGAGKLLAVVECAFTQDYEDLIIKIREEVNSWPEIEFVIVILIKESEAYHSPKEGTATWKFFSAQKECLSHEDFLALSEDENSHGSDENSDSGSGILVSDSNSSGSDTPFLGPIKRAGHMWCNVTSVDYHVWVKKEGETKIDLDNDEKTVGSLYPQISMEKVENMIKQGLSKVKTKLIQISQELGSETKPKMENPVDGAELTVDFKWEKLQIGLAPAVRWTAATRYRNWYNDHFRGTKRACSDDQEYEAPHSATRRRLDH